MNEFVLFKGKRSSKRFVADVALEMFLFGMCLLMRFEVGNLAKGPTADVTFVRFLTGVNSDMFF